MEVDQNVSVVAVDLAEGEPGIPGPEVEGLAQLQPDPAGVQAAGLFGSQAIISRQRCVLRGWSIRPILPETAT